MVMARWQSTIVDDEGNVLPNAQVTVRREAAGAPLATIYQDRDGTVPLGNPFSAGAAPFAADGHVWFHALGGAYRITAQSGAFTRTIRYKGVGLMQESDFAEAFLPRGAWAGGTTYAQNDLVSHEGFAFVSNADGNLANEPTVTGSPPSAPASDANWTHVGTSGTQGIDGTPGSSDVTGSSTTSVAIETGSKMWTVVEENRGWAVGARIRATSDANPTTHYVEGVVTAYSGSDLTMTVDLAVGSGSRADWTFNLAGEPGEDGAQGDPGEQSFVVACSDETTDLETGAAKVTFRMPYAFIVSEVRASVSDPPTGAALQVDINEGGVSILSTEITIDDGDSTSLDAGTPPVISDANLADDAEITIDIDQIGSINAGAGLKVSIIGNPA